MKFGIFKVFESHEFMEVIRVIEDIWVTEIIKGRILGSRIPDIF